MMATLGFLDIDARYDLVMCPNGTTECVTTTEGLQVQSLAFASLLPRRHWPVKAAEAGYCHRIAQFRLLRWRFSVCCVVRT